MPEWSHVHFTGHLPQPPLDSCMLNNLSAIHHYNDLTPDYAIDTATPG